MSPELPSSQLWNAKRQPLVLVGPTATGKTAIAVELAAQINGEIVNADSVQVYRGLNIGAAKPDISERQNIPFHLVDIVDPDENFTAADWKSQAEAAIEDIFRRGKQPIICGGTGLYVRALLDDWSMAATPADPQVREALQIDLQQAGKQALYDRLSHIDAETATRLHPNDTVRILRALEVYLVTGIPISVYQAEDRRTRMPRESIRFGITLPRPTLYERIDHRVNAMLCDGLEAEVRSLLAKGYSPTLSSLRSLGYKEMGDYILGNIALEETVEAIKLHTRQFAKRQQTWFKADTLITWMDGTELSPLQCAEQIINNGRLFN